MSKKVYLVTWTEFEQGWGKRPDGASLHLSQEDVTSYLKNYWSSMPDEAPSEYSKNDSGRGVLVEVSDAVYEGITKLGGSYRMSWPAFRLLLESGEVKK